MGRRDHGPQIQLGCARHHDTSFPPPQASDSSGLRATQSREPRPAACPAACGPLPTSGALRPPVHGLPGGITGASAGVRTCTQRGVHSATLNRSLGMSAHQQAVAPQVRRRRPALCRGRAASVSEHRE
ncbi:hypothetical protein DB31_4058 [Hyalangium minutum]|uniref:Uncharacterized protein n=1 Tax=Hyalangium minutum TaxID=394096 RepID=A0A085W3T5_9BACT|nr:hypothetical protein DB31_4058 [Hyalangium minutum]